MKAIIRIHGMVKMKEKVENTLDRLRLRRKYVCIIVEDTKEMKGIFKKIRDFTAYGEISEDTLKELVKARGKALDGKLDVDKVVGNILKNKTMKESGIKPFFRLHPPRKGIKSKQHFPKGVLGDNKEKINDLIRRML